MKKTILIFGAGLNQLTLIEAARELGLVTIVIDPNNDAPGRKIADYFYRVDGNDYDSTKKIAQKHNISGIVTGQTEKPMRLMARLAQEMGYIFHSPEVTERSLDKWLMKQALINNNVPCAKGLLFKSNEEISERILSDFIYPIVMKPKDATSSQGVFKVDNYNEILKYRKITESFSKNGEVIVEEFLDGPEYSVESITYQGTTTIVQYTEKFVTPFPYTVEMGHLQPADLNQLERVSISEIVIAAINAIGIDNSAAHTEVKLTKRGPKIVEIGARLGGDFISSYLVMNSCGVNMDKAAIQVAIGIKPNLTPGENNYSYIKYIELPVGKKVKEIRNWEKILNEPEVVFADIVIKPGDIIEKITESKKRPGFILVKGRSREEAIYNAEKYCNEMLANITLEK